MKKIRVTVPEDTWRLIKKDSEEFGINNNKLCNFILEKFKYSRKFDVNKLVALQGRTVKKVIQFDLNVANKSIYYDILRENGVEVEAEFFRELFEAYSSKFKYQREIFIFEDTYKQVAEAIRNKQKIKIKYLNEILTLSPYFIKREEQGDENFIFAYDEETRDYRSIKLKEVSIIAVLEEKISLRDKKYIESSRKNFDPFPGERLIVQVRLTKIGESMWKSLTNYRPKFVKKENEIYYFEMTEENAKIYFLPFMKEAEILSPSSLRAEIKRVLEETLKLY